MDRVVIVDESIVLLGSLPVNNDPSNKDTEFFEVYASYCIVYAFKYDSRVMLGARLCRRSDPPWEELLADALLRV